MNKIKLVITIFLIVLMTSFPAYAYLDPSSGSIMLQGLIGGVMGGAFIIKNYLHRFLMFFRSNIRKRYNAPKNLENNSL